MTSVCHEVCLFVRLNNLCLPWGLSVCPSEQVMFGMGFVCALVQVIFGMGFVCSKHSSLIVFVLFC